MQHQRSAIDSVPTGAVASRVDAGLCAGFSPRSLAAIYHAERSNTYSADISARAKTRRPRFRWFDTGMAKRL